MFVTFHLIAWNSPYQAWADFVSNISQYADFEVVRLDQMSSLIHQAQGAGLLTYTPQELNTFWIAMICFLASIFGLTVVLLSKQNFAVLASRTHRIVFSLIRITGLLIVIGLLSTVLYFSQPSLLKVFLMTTLPFATYTFFPLEAIYSFVMSGIAAGAILVIGGYFIFHPRSKTTASNSRLRLKQFVPLLCIETFAGFTFSLALSIPVT